jgi:hypothetical protein
MQVILRAAEPFASWLLQSLFVILRAAEPFASWLLQSLFVILRAAERQLRI